MIWQSSPASREFARTRSPEKAELLKDTNRMKYFLPPEFLVLLREVVAHQLNVIIRQNADQFLVKILAGRSDGLTVALFIGCAALFNVLFQSFVEIAIFPAFRYLGLIVKL